MERHALTGQPDHLTEAAALFHAARAITTASGITARTLRLFDAIAAADPANALTQLRPAAAGKQAGS